MARFPIVLTDDEQKIVDAERDSHPESHVRRKMLALWLLHNEINRGKHRLDRGTGKGHRPAIRRCVPGGRARRTAALGCPRSGERHGLPLRCHPGFADRVPGADHRRGLRPHRGTDRAASRADPGARLPRGPGVPLAADPGHPGAAKKNLTEHVLEQKEFLQTELEPRPEAAQAGRGHVLFVDAAHFVFGTFLCCLWSISRVFVRAASGRQRLDVPGAWNAVTRELIAITDTTVVNTETMCELLRAVASRGLVGPVTMVLDNAKYQRNAIAMGLAVELGIELLFLPSCSPNPNLIERLWRFTKREAAYGRYHATFAKFRSAVEEVLAGIPTKHAEALESLMTLSFQEFDDVSLLAA